MLETVENRKNAIWQRESDHAKVFLTLALLCANVVRWCTIYQANLSMKRRRVSQFNNVVGSEQCWRPALLGKKLFQIQGILRNRTSAVYQALADSSRRLQCTYLIVIVLGSCAIHYWRLSETPRWYGDECNQARWAHSISKGDWTINGRPNTGFVAGLSHTFHLLCNVVYPVLGSWLLAVRFVTATSAIVCTILLYLILKEWGFNYGAFLGPLAWNAHPLSVNFTRWGFPHAVAGCLILASFLFFIRADTRRRYNQLYY